MNRETTFAWIVRAHDAAKFISEQYNDRFDKLRALFDIEFRSHLTGTGIQATLSFSAVLEPLRYRKVYQLGDSIDTAALILELEAFIARCTGKTA